MLWQALRGTAIGLLMALAESLRGSKAHEQPPADTVEASFTMTPPKKPAAQRPGKKIDIKAAA